MPLHNSTVCVPACYRIIEGHPGYRVGCDGTVWSRVVGGCKPRLGDTWRLLKPSPQYRGHMAVYLGRGNCRHVHRLILETFVGQCPEGMECLHWDGNPANNRIDNLRWGTRLENYEDSVRHGTAYLECVRPVGTDHPCSKITEETVLAIMEVRNKTGAGAVGFARL